MSDDMELCPTPAPTSARHQQPLQFISWEVGTTSLSTCLGHILHKPKKFQTKVFSFIYLHKFKMIFTASSKCWPGVQKMHLNLERVQVDRKLTQTVIGADTRDQRAGKVRKSWKDLQPVYELGTVGPPGWQIYNRDVVPSNWHLSLPLLAEPAFVPCSTVRQTGITFQFLGHSVQTRGSRT